MTTDRPGIIQLGPKIIGRIFIIELSWNKRINWSRIQMQMNQH